MTIKRAIILSAGKGSRLLPLTADRPKCLIDFSGRTLLTWQLDALAANGVDEVTIVTGFRSDLVDAEVAGRAGVTTLFNPFYQVADNLGSVWMARHAFAGGDTLLLNGDTLVSLDLVARVLANDGGWPIAVTVDEKPNYDADDMKVERAGDRLVHIGKTLTPEQTDAESIGCLAFRGEGGRRFVDAVEQVMRTPEGTAVWYLRVIDRIAPDGNVGTVAITGEEWGEVDFPADVKAARALTARWAQGWGAQGWAK